MSTDLPLDETALQAVERTTGVKRHLASNAISTYLQEAGFEMDTRSRTIGAKTGFSDPEQRLVGPWVPVKDDS